LELCHQEIVTGPLDPFDALVSSLLLSLPVPQAVRTAIAAPTATALATVVVLIWMRSSPLRGWGKWDHRGTECCACQSFSITLSTPGPIRHPTTREDAAMPVAVPVLTAVGTGRVTALTVDDGPDAVATATLLDLLREHDVRATFCVVGTAVLAPGGAALLRRTVAEGHLVAAHAMTYADLGAWEPLEVREDLTRTVAVIRSALGDPAASVPWFRAPNGSWGCSARVAVELGLQPLGVCGTIDDWLTQDVPTLVANLRAAIRPGGLVLVHDGGGDRSGTVQALRTVLPEWLADGWRFTRPAHPEIDDRDGDDAGEGAWGGRSWLRCARRSPGAARSGDRRC
jgi:endo-1,4-beta-xylanase